MSNRTVFAIALAALGGGIVIGAGAAAGGLAAAGEAKAGPLRSAVMRWKEADPIEDRWGELRKYFLGETEGTRDLFTCIVNVKPGESLHAAHQHAEEEFMVLTRGSGAWHLDGKEIAAEEGDVVYAAPWVFHGLTNTGKEPLQFFVIKWNGKHAPPPPKPAGK